jgi:hypothetical protein
MKSRLALLLVLIGLTFIYNPQTNTGFVYLNEADYNCIIIVDNNTDVLRYYKGVVFYEERLKSGFSTWLQDKVDKGLPFKSAIIPFRQQYDQKRY